MRFDYCIVCFYPYSGRPYFKSSIFIWAYLCDRPRFSNHLNNIENVNHIFRSINFLETLIRIGKLYYKFEIRKQKFPSNVGKLFQTLHPKYKCEGRLRCVFTSTFDIFRLRLALRGMNTAFWLKYIPHRIPKRPTSSWNRLKWKLRFYKRFSWWLTLFQNWYDLQKIYHFLQKIPIF